MKFPVSRTFNSNGAPSRLFILVGQLHSPQGHSPPSEPVCPRPSPPFHWSLVLHSCVSAPRVNMSALWLCTILLAALSCSARPNMPPGNKLYVLHTYTFGFFTQNITFLKHTYIMFPHGFEFLTGSSSYMDYTIFY